MCVNGRNQFVEIENKFIKNILLIKMKKYYSDKMKKIEEYNDTFLMYKNTSLKNAAIITSWFKKKYIKKGYSFCAYWSSIDNTLNFVMV